MFSLDHIYKAGFAIGALCLLIFFLGHLGLLAAPYLALSCVVAGAGFFLSVRGRGAGQAPRLSRLDLLLVAATVLLLLAILPLSLTPPAVRDELIQHLALPRLYLAKGGIFEIPFMGFSYLPQNIDMLYTVPLAFGAEAGPRLIHMGFAVLTGLLVYFYLLPGSGRAYALLGLFLYLATPLSVNLSRMAYIDHGAAFFSTLALMAALKWREEGFPTKWLFYSAVSMGLALGAKYNTVLSFAILGAFVVYAPLKDRRGLAAAARAGAMFAVVALAVLSPWLLRNYAWKGSPFYPLWESAAKAAARGEAVHVTGEMAPVGKRLLLYGEGVFDIVLLPLRLFWEGADNSIRRFDGVLNPFFLAFLPLAFFGRRRGDGDLKFLAVFSLLFFALAFLSVDLVTRYLLPVLPVVAILVTLGFRNLVEMRGLRWAAWAVMAALLVFDAGYVAGLYKRVSPLGYLSGRESRGQYLSRTLPDYDAVSYANGALTQGARVMLLFSGDRGYYWDRYYVYGDRNGVALGRMIRASADARGLRERLSAGGTTHLFLNDRLMEKFLNDNLDERGLALAADFFNNHAARLYSSNGFSLFEMKQPAAAR